MVGGWVLSEGFLRLKLGWLISGEFIFGILQHEPNDEVSEIPQLEGQSR